jgi:hypothetical protein
MDVWVLGWMFGWVLDGCLGVGMDVWLGAGMDVVALRSWDEYWSV